MPEVTTQVFNSCRPRMRSGESVSIAVDQELWIDVDQDLTDNEAAPLLDTTAPRTVTFEVNGPRLRLGPADIAGVYPAPGSEESPDQFLPHVALGRRTLPWERRGPTGNDGDPWLALLLVKESELKLKGSSVPVSVEHLKIKDIEKRDPFSYEQLSNELRLADKADVDVIFLSKATLKKVFPLRSDLRFLCHVKRVLTGDASPEDFAIVISNRLPEAPEEGRAEVHTALLVSLESRFDVYSNPNRESTALIVLHHWSFTPSHGGDFQQVMKAISFRPNGGVLRFGNLPQTAAADRRAPLSGGFAAVLDQHGFPIDPLPHTQPHDVVFRGPLRPYPPPTRGKGFAVRAAPEEFLDAEPGAPFDSSHAAAFEIGRLLALNDSGILDDLHRVKWHIPPIDTPVLESEIVSPINKKVDPVVNPQPFWLEEPWSRGPGEPMVKAEEELTDAFGEADPTRIRQQLAPERDVVISVLSKLAAPVSQPVAQVDIATATNESLSEQFPEVANTAFSA